MIERRERQLARVPGFTPSNNKRIDAEIARLFTDLLKTCEDPFEAATIAVSQIAATLPPLPIVHRHRAPRPSKSGHPAYRKNTRCDPQTA